MSKDGFNLRNGDSHDEPVKRLICHDNSKTIKKNEIRKVLGINWNISHEEFKLEISNLVKLALQLPATKRNNLSIIAMFYDPFGLVSSIILQLKLIYSRSRKRK